MDFVLLLDADTKVCPKNWIDATSVDMGCLHINTNSKGTWDDAQSFRESIENQKAFLVEILTEDQMDFLAKELDTINAADKYWTGGTDEGSEGQWYWATSLKEMGDFVLASGQPNGGHSNNCVGLWPGLNFLGGDDDCSRYRLH